MAQYTMGVKKQPVIVARKGQSIAALVSIENADLETAPLSTNRRFLKLIERSRARQRTEGGISSDEIRRKLDVKKAGQAYQPPPSL